MPSWLQIPATPDTRHTHTHSAVSVCPSGICVSTVSAQCVNICGGLVWGRGRCLNLSLLPFPQLNQSPVLPENFCLPRAAAGPAPPLFLAIPSPSPSFPLVPARPATPALCTHTHPNPVSTARVKCPVPRLARSVTYPRFLGEPVKPRTVCDSLEEVWDRGIPGPGSQSLLLTGQVPKPKLPNGSPGQGEVRNLWDVFRARGTACRSVDPAFIIGISTV